MSCANCTCPFSKIHAEDGPFSQSELDCLFADVATRVEFQPGEALFTQGQVNNNLYAVRSGVIKIIDYAADGREQIVGLGTPGQLLVGLQSISHDRCEYGAVAVTEVSACRIRHRTVLSAVEDNVEIAVKLIDAFNCQLAHSRSLVHAMGRKSALAKIASLILLLAPEKAESNGRFELPFSRNDMAELLGLSEETVCRQMANLKRGGTINAPHGSMEICDWNQLSMIAEERPRAIEAILRD